MVHAECCGWSAVCELAGLDHMGPDSESGRGCVRVGRPCGVANERSANAGAHSALHTCCMDHRVLGCVSLLVVDVEVGGVLSSLALLCIHSFIRGHSRTPQGVTYGGRGVPEGSKRGNVSSLFQKLFAKRSFLSKKSYL